MGIWDSIFNTAVGAAGGALSGDECAVVASVFQEDAQARAYYACKFYAAVKENARVNEIIAGIQQAAAFYFADKQHDIAKQAQNRLDAQWNSEKEKGDKLFNHWDKNAREEEIEQLHKASDREEKGYQIDYETAKNRVLADVRGEYGRAREKLRREASPHCVGAVKMANRWLNVQEARAAVAAVNSAYRAEENRKDLKEAQYREELYKWLALFRGVVGDSLNASKGASAAAAAASQVNPYAGWANAFQGLGSLGNAIKGVNYANMYMQNAGMYGSLFGGGGGNFGGGMGGISQPFSTVWVGNSGMPWATMPLSQAGGIMNLGSPVESLF